MPALLPLGIEDVDCECCCVGGIMPTVESDELCCFSVWGASIVLWLGLDRLKLEEVFSVAEYRVLGLSSL